jgi:hypothetical protein
VTSQLAASQEGLSSMSEVIGYISVLAIANVRVLSLHIYRIYAIYEILILKNMSKVLKRKT